MKKEIQFKIQRKYFNAILELKKPFEIRHKKIKKGSIIKLVEINDAFDHVINETGRFIVFESGNPKEINRIESLTYDHGHTMKIIQNKADETEIIVDYLSACYNKTDSWYDDFCWKYIQEKQSYIIPIEKIIEVK